MVTLKDIARVAGVSESTVSKVIGKSSAECRVSEPLQRRVREVAKRLDYKPNMMARGLATRQSGNIAMIIYRYEHLTHPVMTQTLSGIAQAISKSPYGLTIQAIYHPGRQENQTQKLRDLIDKKQADGLVVVAHETDPLEILDLIKAEYPFSLVNFYYPRLKADEVRVNFIEVGKRVVKYFAELGHKKIAILPGPESYGGNSYPNNEDLIAGVQAAAAELGIRIPPERLITTDYDAEEAFEAISALLDSNEPPTAIYAGDDAIAKGVFKAIQSKGLNVPSDVSILCGADTYLTQLAPVPLSAIQIPYTEIGYKAVELLISKLEGKSNECQQMILPFQIIERESCTRRTDFI